MVINVHFINIRGYKYKQTYVSRHMRESCDFLVLTETWLLNTDRIKNQNNIILDLRQKRLPTASRGNGGIVIVKRNRTRIPWQILEVDKEKNWVIINIDQQIIFICYAAPSMETHQVDNLLSKMTDSLIKFPSLIFIGDFNSRHINFGDTRTNTRGRIIYNWLNSTQVNIYRITPSSGMWTTYNHKGRGITDHIFTSERNDRIHKYSINENEDMGGSDHRLLQLQLTATQTFVTRDNNTIDINKLIRDIPVQMAFQDTLSRNMSNVHIVACNMLQRLTSQITQQSHWSDVRRQMSANQVWQQLKEVIVDAAYQVIGRKDVKEYENKHFNTFNIRRLRRERIIARNIAQILVNRGAPSQDIKMAWRRVGCISQQLNKREQRQRTIVFQSSMDILSVDPNGAMKMIKATQKRQNRTGCKLNIQQMNEHTEVFKNTFGSTPTGTEPLELHVPRPRKLKKCTLIKIETVSNYILTSPNRKAPGCDALPFEIYKYGGKELHTTLTIFFNILQILEVIPSEWQKCLVHPIYKNKGDESHISNYRPIALTNSIRRIYEKCIARRLKRKLQQILTNRQGGFLENKSTIDQVFRLNKIMKEEKYAYVTFLDIKAAYDTVNRSLLWQEMLRKKFKFKDIRILQSLFSFNTSTLLIDGTSSDEIPNNRGLLQGSTLSPALFNVYINILSEKLDAETGGIYENNGNINHLLYADDLVLFSTDITSHQRLLDICNIYGEHYGLTYAVHKCATLHHRRTNTAFTLQGEHIQTTTIYNYLGIAFDNKGINWKHHVQEKINKATKVAHILHAVGMNTYGWRLRTSIHAYKVFIRPILEYGISAAILPKYLIQKYQMFQNIILRRIVGVGRNVQIDKLHALTCMEKIDIRNKYLYYRFILSKNVPSHPLHATLSSAAAKLDILEDIHLYLDWKKRHKTKLTLLDTGPLYSRTETHMLYMLLLNNICSYIHTCKRCGRTHTQETSLQCVITREELQELGATNFTSYSSTMMEIYKKGDIHKNKKLACIIQHTLEQVAGWTVKTQYEPPRRSKLRKKLVTIHGMIKRNILTKQRRA